MNNYKEILSLLKQYLEKSIAPNGFWDNVVEYILPISSVLFVIIGGIWTVYTYTKAKNKETNERILAEVYLPLFQFFVTNDSLTQIGNINIDYKKDPFLIWKRKKIVTQMEAGKTNTIETESEVMGLSRESFMEAVEKINIGLAPRGLVALLSTYKAVNYAVDNFTSEKEIMDRAVQYRTELEYAIRTEAYSGYKKYHKKLGLLNSVTKDTLKIYDDHIQLLIKPLSEKGKGS